MMNNDIALERLDYAIQKGSNYCDFRWAGLPEFYDFRTAGLSALSFLLPASELYHLEFLKRVGEHSELKEDGRIGLALLKSATHEVKRGWLISNRKLISSELFNDFLERAEYFLASNYKDAASVMIGGTLEEHLRELCKLHDIPDVIQKKGKAEFKQASLMNEDLHKAGVYNALDQKSITAWLGIRNKAAHGRYTEFNEDQVELFLAGVRDFIARTT